MLLTFTFHYGQIKTGLRIIPHPPFKNLHSTMVRLKLYVYTAITGLLNNLHSTMVRLKLIGPCARGRILYAFTFHYGQIKTHRRLRIRYLKT